MKYKGFEVNDNLIDEYVEKLDISIAEACQLILEEKGTIEESTETKKAIEETTKNAPRRYEKGNSKRKKTERERKVDDTKAHLLACTKTLIEGLGATNTSIKTETELKFEYEGASYTFKLTKHRPPKK